MTSTEDFNDVAVNLLTKNLFLTIPGSTVGPLSVARPGETVHIPNLVVYSFFVKRLAPALKLSENVVAVFVKDSDVWHLSSSESDLAISFTCQGDKSQDFIIRLDSQSNEVVLQRHNDGEYLETSQLDDFESNDQPKLRFLYRSLRSKYEENLISVNCLLPYDENFPLITLGRCGWKCFWNSACEDDPRCKCCRWFGRFECGK